MMEMVVAFKARDQSFMGLRWIPNWYERKKDKLSFSLHLNISNSPLSLCIECHNRI